MLGAGWSEVAAVLAAYVIAALATPAGISGAVLLLPFQVSVLGTPSPAVTPTNLLYNVVATPGALYRYWRQGQTGGRLALVLTARTLPGVIAGSVIRVYLEAAWARLGPEVNQARHALATRATRSDADISAVRDALRLFRFMLTWQCRGLTGDELITVDRVVERKLYDIDQAAIQAVTGGLDDGFLYARGFIIAMGKDFYHAVASDPQIAVPGSECDEMCYFFAHLHRERFGQFPYTGSGISRESGSNPASWPG
jgi:hypothetical protein